MMIIVAVQEAVVDGPWAFQVRNVKNNRRSHWHCSGFLCPLFVRLADPQLIPCLCRHEYCSGPSRIDDVSVPKLQRGKPVWGRELPCDVSEGPSPAANTSITGILQCMMYASCWVVDYLCQRIRSPSMQGFGVGGLLRCQKPSSPVGCFPSKPLQLTSAPFEWVLRRFYTTRPPTTHPAYLSVPQNHPVPCFLVVPVAMDRRQEFELASRYESDLHQAPEKTRLGDGGMASLLAAHRQLPIMKRKYRFRCDGACSFDSNYYSPTT